MTAPVPRIGERASWDRVLAALESRGLVTRVRGDSHADARCPAHDDGRASLTADYRPGEPGRVLLCCHAGCEFGAVVAALGLAEADTFDGPSPDRERAPRPRPAARARSAAPAASPARVRCARCRWAEVEVYRYTDRGEVVLEVIRKQCQGCGAKNFPVRRPDGRGGWEWRWPDHRPLYRLDQVREAVGQRGTVYVAEGEKDVHALEAAGLTATCNPGGAGKWRPAHTRSLMGAGRVVVVADRDKAGYKHAAAVRDEFTFALVEVVEAAEGKDPADHFAAGHAVAEFVPIDPDVKLAELEAAEAAARVTALDDHRGTRGQPRDGRGQPSGGGGGDGGQADPARLRPSGRVPMSRRAGVWGYALEGEEFPGFDGRGVYELDGETWRKAAPLPHCHVRVIRRDGTGSQVGTEFLVSATADGPRKMMGHLGLHDGSWANELGVPLSDDPRIVQAAGTAVRELAHSDGVPEREAVPRLDGDGRASVPVPECLPGGYLACAPGTRAAGLGGWQAIAAAVAATPKLAAVLGASAFGPYMRALRRQSYWFDLFGEPGQGKTTALTLAAGVWGAALGDDQAVRLSWNDTAIGLSRHLGSLGILPAFTDESGMAGFAPAQWGELIFRTTEGNQRTTAERKSIQGTNRSLPWGGVLFVSGNGRVTAGLGAGKYSGLVRRVISVASPFTASAVEAERLVGGYETPHGEHVPGLLDGCYGHLGAELLARFGADDARRFLAEAAVLVGPLPEEAVPRTLAKHLHAAVAGAAMADEVTGGGTVLRDAAAGFAREYLAEHGASPEHDADRIIAAVREAIAREPASWPTKSEYAEHLQAPAETVLGAVAPGRIALPQRGMAREFAGVRADDGSWVAVFPAVFHDELAARLGVDEGLALAELFRRGVLAVSAARRARGEWQTAVRLEPKPAAPVVMYKLALPEADDEDDEITGMPAQAAPAPAVEADSPATPAEPQRQDPPPSLPEIPAEPQRQDPPPSSARAAAGGAAGFVTASERFAAPAVIADVDFGYLARPDRLEALDLPSPLRDLADAAGWAATLRLGLAHDGGMPDDPVLVILPELAARLGLPASPPERGTKAAKGHAALGPLRASGWNVNQLGSWMRAWKPGGRTVRLWLPGWDEYGTCPMWGDGVPASTLASRLGLFAERLGIGWRMNGGITGIDLGKTFPRRSLRLETADPPKIARAPLETEIVWSRKPLSDEAGLAFLHCYDGNGAYTSAYNTPVNCGGWRHVEAPAFDPKMPGYWLAELPAWADQFLPDPADPTGRDARTGRRSGLRWRATPTLAGFAELGYEVKPREAWLPSGAYGRYWEPWYERVRDARAAVVASADVDDQTVLGGLRSVWHATHGAITIDSQGKRPDHNHTIIAAYRANLVRRLARVGEAEGRWPLAISTDNVAYASADPDPAAACPAGIKLGTKLGQFKHSGTLPMADAVPLLGTGRSADLTDQARGLFELARKYVHEHGRKG